MKAYGDMIHVATINGRPVEVRREIVDLLLVLMRLRAGRGHI